MQVSRKSAVVASWALFACARGDAPSEWEGTIRDSAGVTVVHNSEQGLWKPGEGWSVREELKIGTMAGDPSYEFGSVGGVVRTSDRRVFVLDRQAATVRIYSENGDFERQFAGPGRGPGELSQRLGVMALLPGDVIAVYDVGNQRVTRYDAAGRFVNSDRPVNYGQTWYPLATVATPSGRFVTQRHFFSMANRPAVDSTDLLLLHGPEGSVEDTILRVPRSEFISFTDRGRRDLFYIPASRWTMVGDSTLIYGHSSQYRLGFYDLQGGLLRVVLRDVGRAVVSDQDQELTRRAYQQRYKFVGGGADLPMQAVRQRLIFTDSFPAFHEIAVGREQSLWVRRIRPPSQLPEDQRESFAPWRGVPSPEWDVFDADGRYLGVVQLPERFDPTQFVDDEIYGIWRDDLDVQYVLRLRIVDHRA